jgi:hypothetical protein
MSCTAVAPARRPGYRAGQSGRPSGSWWPSRTARRQRRRRGLTGPAGRDGPRRWRSAERPEVPRLDRQPFGPGSQRSAHPPGSLSSGRSANGIRRGWRAAMPRASGAWPSSIRGELTGIRTQGVDVVGWAAGGLVEALVVGQDVLVEDLQDAPVELAHLLLREVQHEAGRGPDRAWPCLAELGLEGLDRGDGLFVVAVVVGFALVGVAIARQPPGLPAGAVRLLQGTAGPGADRGGLQQSGLDQQPDVVQGRARLAVQPVGELLVGHGLLPAQAQDPQAQRMRGRLGLEDGGPPTACIHRRHA